MEQLVDNRYRIVRPLGSGGMAEVYLAHDDVLDRDVALKVMSGRYAHDDEFVERFRREAQSAAALTHPRIVSIYDRGESEEGTYYIAMEYLPGGTLKDRISKRGALSARTATAVALQIAEALQAAHQAEVVHRDIKPHNVLVTAAGDIKVGDFGIARAASSSTMTKTGSILGTAHYISPEQAMGEPVGYGSDLYSLGIVLYEMLTGTLPYDADTPIGVAMKHVNGYLVAPRKVNPEVPEGINAVTIRLLEKDPNDRYTDAAELIEDLERVMGGHSPASATTRVMTRRTPAAPALADTTTGIKRERRRRWVLILLILLLLAALGGFAYYTLAPRPVPEVAVPNLVGYTSIEEARDMAGEDFQIVVGDRVESQEAPGTIVDQDPEAEEMRAQGSTIYVDVSGTQVTALPNVEGETRAEAERILEQAGFGVEVESAESSSENEGYVTGQNPRGGEGITAAVDSEVTITVGEGPDAVEVPDLYNRTVDEARQALERAGLVLGRQTEAPSERVAAGSIVQQNPGAGEQASPDSSVDVVVSSGPAEVSVPNVVGLGAAAARQTLYDAGFGSTTEIVQSDQPEGTVVSTDPEVGTTLDPSSRNVTIQVSAGPPLPAPAPAEPVPTAPVPAEPIPEPAPQPSASPPLESSGKTKAEEKNNGGRVQNKGGNSKDN